MEDGCRKGGREREVFSIVTGEGSKGEREKRVENRELGKPTARSRKSRERKREGTPAIVAGEVLQGRPAGGEGAIRFHEGERARRA